METSLEKGWVKVDGPDRSGRMVAVIEHFNLGGSWETSRTGINMGACDGHSEAQTLALPLPSTEWWRGGEHLTSLSLTLPVSKMEQTPLEKVGTGAQETSPFLWTKCWADLVADLIVANKEREPSSDEKRTHLLFTSSGLISLCCAL